MTWVKSTLDCGHTQHVNLMKNVPKQPGDITYILCNYCKRKKNKSFHSVDTAWRKVLSNERASDESMSDVSDGDAYQLPRYVLRLTESGAVRYPYRS